MYVLFIVDYESCGMIHMDSHMLSPCFMEDGIEVECLSFQKPGSHSSEFESASVLPQQPVVIVKGGLRKCAGFWINELDASQFVRDIVTAGYCLPFSANPPAVCANNHKSALENSTFVSEAV